MKFILGLLIGLALGVAVGLLIAPQSGEVTRAQLTEQGGVLLRPDTIDTLRSRANDAVSQAREVYTRTKNDLTGRYEQARSGKL
jgi:gas vesicle protein